MILLLIIFVLMGMAVGSFLNVVSDRLPAGVSIVSAGLTAILANIPWHL